jgi:predicted RNA-binding protein
MKSNWLKNWIGVGVAVLTTAAAFGATADEAAQAAMPEKSYTGTVAAIDAKEHVLSVKGWGFWKKSFNLGENCTYALWDKTSGTVNDLRPGEKILVSYQDAHGVLIASHVEQQPMRFEGMVKSISPDKHTLTIHRPASEKQLQVAADCKIKLRDGKSGSLENIRVGDHVTVTYETPEDKATALEIAQTSLEFTGRLTAVDLEEKTLKTKSGFESKKFMLANHCAIVINGKTDGKLADLTPNEKLVLNYDEINGINVVNRIAPADAKNGPATDSIEPLAGN